MGAEVTGYALEPPTEPSLFEQAEVAGLVRSLRGDVRDYAQLKSAIEEARPDVVLHMAAQSVVYQGYEDPVGTYSSNVMGTVHLFEALRQIGRPCSVVNVTSDKCYENREWVWGYRESDPMGGHDPYSNSKGCAELVSSAYRDSFFSPDRISEHGIALGTARAGNAIGGGDWTSHQLIPDLVRAFLAHEPCVIRNPSAYRPWQFVLEPLRGYLLLAERLVDDPARFATGWNFGPVNADIKPVSWISDAMVRLWSEDAAWKLDSTSHPHEAHALRLETSKAATELHWQPALPLAGALEWIVEWYRGYRDGVNLRKLTLSQIERYQELVQAEI
jgi:CDP-glucose 4,6-dehydratase